MLQAFGDVEDHRCGFALRGSPRLATLVQSALRDRRFAERDDALNSALVERSVASVLKDDYGRGQRHVDETRRQRREFAREPSQPLGVLVDHHAESALQPNVIVQEILGYLVALVFLEQRDELLICKARYLLMGEARRVRPPVRVPRSVPGVRPPSGPAHERVEFRSIFLRQPRLNDLKPSGKARVPHLGTVRSGSCGRTFCILAHCLTNLRLLLLGEFAKPFQKCGGDLVEALG